MKFKFEGSKHNIRFIRFKNCYFIKSCKGQRCISCELNDENDCFGLCDLDRKIFLLLIKKGRF